MTTLHGTWGPMYKIKWTSNKSGRNLMSSKWFYKNLFSKSKFHLFWRLNCYDCVKIHFWHMLATKSYYIHTPFYVPCINRLFQSGMQPKSTIYNNKLLFSESFWNKTFLKYFMDVTSLGFESAGAGTPVEICHLRKLVAII